MKSNGWLIEQEEEVFSTTVGRILKARVTSDRTGRLMNFYRFDLSDWVNIVAVTPQQEIVCIRQFRFGSKRMELEIPGGAIEADETPLAAGLRELMEETGYQGKNAGIIGSVCPNPAIQQNRCYTVLVEDAVKTGEQQLDDMEEIEVFTLPLAEIERLVDTGEIEHGLVLNALMFYFRNRG